MDLFVFIKGHSEEIPSEIIMKIASDIASGMNMMHSAGIVHRDLKSLTFSSFLYFFSYFLKIKLIN